MEWSNAYLQQNEPSLEDMSIFIGSGLFDELCLHLTDTYSSTPKIEYSKCSMQRGWNVKYRKKGKSLCTLYPMDGYFISLVVIGEKERMEAEHIITGCSEYVQTLFRQTLYSMGGKWLMIDVKEQATLRDVKDFIAIRMG